MFHLHTEIDTCEDSKHFTLFAQFAKSSWPQVVRAQLKSMGQPYSDSWEAVMMENTENACFTTLLNLENGMQHGSMANGVKDWKIIFLALCAGCEFEQKFGEFTFSQWLVVTQPKFFEFLVRFVIWFDGTMIEFDQLHLMRIVENGEALETEFATRGEHDLSIIHVMAFQRQLSSVCHNKMMRILCKELTPAITDKMSKRVDQEEQKKEVYGKMLQLLTGTYNVYTEAVRFHHGTPLKHFGPTFDDIFDKDDLNWWASEQSKADYNFPKLPFDPKADAQLGYNQSNR